MFGVLLIFLVKADIFLGLADGNTDYLMVLSFIAGINERFVPDLLDRTVKEVFTD